MGRQWARAHLFERSPGLKIPTADWLALHQLAKSLSEAEPGPGGLTARTIWGLGLPVWG